MAYAGQGSVKEEHLCLHELIHNTADLVRASTPDNVELELSFPESSLPVLGDRTQLQQVVMNMLLNAVEAISEQQGKVSVRARVRAAGEIDFGAAVESPLATEGPFVTIEVKDTGLGMDEATLARVFDPFFTTKFTGRGLGLAASIGIVRAHQGALSVHSEVGQGSVFSLYLPVASSSGTTDSPATPC